MLNSASKTIKTFYPNDKLSGAAMLYTPHDATAKCLKLYVLLISASYVAYRICLGFCEQSKITLTKMADFILHSKCILYSIKN